jgi:hypothetical protein
VFFFFLQQTEQGITNLNVTEKKTKKLTVTGGFQYPDENGAAYVSSKFFTQAGLSDISILF